LLDAGRAEVRPWIAAPGIRCGRDAAPRRLKSATHRVVRGGGSRSAACGAPHQVVSSRPHPGRGWRWAPPGARQADLWPAAGGAQRVCAGRRATQAAGGAWMSRSLGRGFGLTKPPAGQGQRRPLARTLAPGHHTRQQLSEPAARPNYALQQTGAAGIRLNACGVPMPRRRHYPSHRRPPQLNAGVRQRREKSGEFALSGTRARAHVATR